MCSPDDKENCDKNWWTVKFKVEDSKSGLHLVNVKPTSNKTFEKSIFYK